MANVTLIQFQHKFDYFPLGPIYLAHGLERENIQFDLKIFPLYKYPNNLDKLYSFFARAKDIIAIGCWSDMLPYVIAASKKVKHNFPQKKIILGGIGPTDVAENILKEFEFIDFVIKGCGVYRLPKLIKNISSGYVSLDNIDGLVYRCNNKVIANRYEGFSLNIPNFPAYNRIKNISSYNSFDIFSSFGCPYQCAFCSIHTLFSRKIIYRDLNNVIEEIRLIESIKQGKKFFVAIRDEAFIIKRERVIQFCNLIKSEKLNIDWSCYGRIDRMDEELLRIMSESGCKGIFYGVESSSNRVLKKIKKGFTIEKAIKILLLSKKYIEDVMASFICLYPFEKIDDFFETVINYKFLVSKGISVNLNPLAPVKNSEIFHKYKKNLSLFKHIKNSFHIKLTDMPKECVNLIKRYPEIFYSHYFYDFSDLNEILRIKESHFPSRR